MTGERRKRIIELIQERKVENQTELAEILTKEGFETTQATVSRDIKELKLVKQKEEGSKSYYALPPTPEKQVSERFIKILRETITDIKDSENIIVVHTLPGCANAAAEAIDSVESDAVLGSIAGDNTIFLVIKNKEHVSYVMESMYKIING